MSESRSERYTVRLSPSEEANLRAKAKAQGVNLADAMREGAALYLDSGAAAAKAIDPKLVNELEAQVDRARAVLRSANTTTPRREQ